MSQAAPDLRSAAADLGAALPALLVQAGQLGAALAFGAHGRRRAGAGDAFWQYRPAQQGDAAGAIDWRRSAKSDAPFVREREWQALNTLTLWPDGAQSMQFSSAKDLPSKAARAQLLALSLAVMALRGGERVGLMGGQPARTGRHHIVQLAGEMARMPSRADYADFGAGGSGHAGVASAGAAPGAYLVFLSDFLGPLPALQSAMTQAADRGARGALVQILDPAEESFPYAGRVLFHSMGGSLAHETQSAGDLRARYQARLAARKDAVAALARSLGWGHHIHHTNQPPMGALIWAHHAVSGAMA